MIENQQHRRTRWLVLLLFVVVCIAGLSVGVVYLSSPRDILMEDGIVESQMMGQAMEFSIYLPPGYSSRGERYPVLYLLHGFTGDHTTYPRVIGVKKIADEAIRNSRAVPMLIVMPKSRGGMYINLPNGNYCYEDYFFQELIPLVEKNYHVLNGKEGRAIAGHSMGGNGAILYALKHPTLFESCCAIGAAIDMNVPENNASFSDENNIPNLLKRTADAVKAASPEEHHTFVVRFYIDCGKEDGLLDVNKRLHVCMDGLGFAHEFYQRDGGHTWDYWRSALPFVLEFAFRTKLD